MEAAVQPSYPLRAARSPALIAGVRQWLARIDWQRPVLRDAATLLLFLAIGIELLVLATWAPDTLRVWSDPETHGYGDFSGVLPQRARPDAQRLL
jgi:hypothetical protein